MCGQSGSCVVSSRRYPEGPKHGGGTARVACQEADTAQKGLLTLAMCEHPSPVRTVAGKPMESLGNDNSLRKTNSEAIVVNVATQDTGPASNWNPRSREILLPE